MNCVLCLYDKNINTLKGIPLCFRCFDKVLTKKENMMAYSKAGFAPKPVNEVNFGKYKGKTFEEVYGIDPDYLRWMRDTTDSAAAKKEGKYAKQNQARIRYITDLLDGGPTTTVGTPLPPKVQAEAAPKTFAVIPSTFKTILKNHMSLEEKVDVLLKQSGGDKVIRPSEMNPDDDVPFSDEPEVV